MITEIKNHINAVRESMRGKKGLAALDMLVGGVLSFVFIIVALVVGSKVTTSIRGTITDTNSAAYNATMFGEKSFQSA